MLGASNNPVSQGNKIIEFFRQALRAYASVLFIKNTTVGAIIAIATFIVPNIGATGLLSVLLGALLCRLFKFQTDRDGLYLFNALLTGLGVGAFYAISPASLLLLLLAIFLVIFLTFLLNAILWQFNRLPALSLPFVIVTFSLFFAGRNFDRLKYFLPSLQYDVSWLPKDINGFFETMGAIFFVPHAIMGMVVLGVLITQSRYLALLGVLGYLVGYFTLSLLIAQVPDNFLAWSAFNFALTAMALGGILTVPSFVSFVVALIGASIAALITATLHTFLQTYQLPVLAAPFVLSTLTVLAALKVRTQVAQPYVAPNPNLPEVNYERARLAAFRNGDINSVPLLAPFQGEWTVYQGVDGPHTHKGDWRHALDFYKIENGKSFENNGDNLHDFYCFGLPVIAPVYGTVIRCFDGFADNKPGEMDTEYNWGNFILIKLDFGHYVLLAHLRQHSIKVKEKQRVEPGDLIAACGNSGRSPQPHLHVQVQRTADLNSPTHTFHLASILNINDAGQVRYALVSVPKTGEAVAPAGIDDALSQPLHLPVGRRLQYEWIRPDDDNAVTRTLMVVVTFEGEYRLQSDSGASAAFSEANGVIAFYDRNDVHDEFFDAWLLAMGLTPLSERANEWSDAPSYRLLPLNLFQTFWLWLCYPLGKGLQSSYRRKWMQASENWEQSGEHLLQGSLHKHCKTIATIDPKNGCNEFVLEVDQAQWQAKLQTIGLSKDEGIPGWSEAFQHE